MYDFIKVYICNLCKINKRKHENPEVKALGLSFYLQKLYKINNVCDIVTLKNNKRYI